MEQVHRTFVLTAAPDTQYAAQLQRVMQACKDKCGRSRYSVYSVYLLYWYKSTNMLGKQVT